MTEPHDQIPNSKAPELSVVLVVGGQRERAARALHSVLEQDFIDRIEVLLFDLGPNDSPPLRGSDHPHVRLTRLGPSDLLGSARLQGVRRAKAPIVAFIEEHAEMGPGWAKTIVAAHREPWAAVGSDLVNGNPGAGVSDKAFRMNYGLYVRGSGGRGPVPAVAGQNSAYKRDVLLRYEENLEAMLSADLVLQWKMQQDGHRLFYEPTVSITHTNENSFSSLAVGVFYWNWCFANIRAQVFQWGFFRRAAWLGLSPLMPWVRVFRIFRRIVAERRFPLLKFLGDVPFVLGISYCAAAGQAAGLLNRRERGIRAFSHFETNEPRLSQVEMSR
jgi:hypothetical protein